MAATSRHPGADAEAQLCRGVTPAVRGFAWRRLRRRDAIEDFVHDVLARLILSLRGGQVDDPAHPGPFVLATCRRLARDGARRDPLWRPALEVEPPPSTRELAHLEDCVGQLTQRARDVLQAAFVDGASNREIAERLSLSESHVRVVRHRGIATLRDCLSQDP